MKALICFGIGFGLIGGGFFLLEVEDRDTNTGDAIRFCGKGMLYTGCIVILCAIALFGPVGGGFGRYEWRDL